VFETATENILFRCSPNRSVRPSPISGGEQNIPVNYTNLPWRQIGTLAFAHGQRRAIRLGLTSITHYPHSESALSTDVMKTLQVFYLHNRLILIMELLIQRSRDFPSGTQPG